MRPPRHQNPEERHVPVLLGRLMERIGKAKGAWIDGTFGAGGFAKALLKAGAEKVVAIDRDPLAARMAAAWMKGMESRITLVEGKFSDLAGIARAQGISGASGVVLDIGVSSMQIDCPDRGFSFTKDGPLDMRMGGQGRTARDLVNGQSEAALADMLRRYGEERAARRIARRIAESREASPIETTGRLASLVSACLPPTRRGQPHPATRSFQALRIAVNNELEELAEGLLAAEEILEPGGLLAVVTFHSLEDRIVKRFMAAGSGESGGPNRHSPGERAQRPRFERVTRKAIAADSEEIARNPRSRSARLRIARRLDAPPARVPHAELGVPKAPEWSAHA